MSIRIQSALQYGSRPRCTCTSGPVGTRLATRRVTRQWSVSLSGPGPPRQSTKNYLVSATCHYQYHFIHFHISEHFRAFCSGYSQRFALSAVVYVKVYRIQLLASCSYTVYPFRGATTHRSHVTRLTRVCVGKTSATAIYHLKINLRGQRVIFVS